MTINALLLAEHKLLAGSVDEKLRECTDIKVEPVWTVNTLIRKIKGNGKEYDLVIFYFDGLNSLHESTGSTYIQLRNSGYKGKILLLAGDAELINERIRAGKIKNVYASESTFTAKQIQESLNYLFNEI